MFRLALFVVVISAAGAAAAEPVNHSRIAFTLGEKDLLPENVAWDARNGRFLIGSTRRGKIVSVRDGVEDSFIAARSGGLWMVIGMKVDAARRSLWVASSAGGNLVDLAPGDKGKAGLFHFDLDDGRLRGRWLLDNNGQTHFLNDLVVADDGDVYVTHMFDQAMIYRLDAETETFAPFFKGDKAFEYPNGITFNADQSALYVAHRGGISRIDMSSRERRAISFRDSSERIGADGIYFHQNALIAVQGASVDRFHLDDTGLTVTRTEVLEAAHPLFNRPTTGVVVDDAFYYIANAQFDSFDDDGTLFPMERLYEPVVLRVDL